MEIRFTGKNIEVTEPLRAYAEEKIARLTRFFRQIYEVDVELTREKNPSIAAGDTVEVTLYTRGPLIRAKGSAVDMFAAVDVVVDKLERQIKRYKDKIYSSASRNHTRQAVTSAPAEQEEQSDIVRVKQIDMKPMTAEEATIQMNLLGHDFFVFTNADTERINVIYRRRDNNYGLIEPL